MHGTHWYAYFAVNSDRLKSQKQRRKKIKRNKRRRNRWQNNPNPNRTKVYRFQQYLEVCHNSTVDLIF